VSHAGTVFAGVMSGTSLDGADAVVVDFRDATLRVLGSASRPFHPDLRQLLQRLCAPGSDGFDEAGAAGVALAQIYAEAVKAACGSAGISAGDVSAIGCHGQTVRHRPERSFTIQWQDPARLAELTGIDVIADFRRRDVAAGGQGAPLVPAFHDEAFRSPDVARAIVNIGGIANITVLVPGEAVTGFDCGPGNALLDGWFYRHRNGTFDRDGAWAGGGLVRSHLLDRLLADAFFGDEPPKSTGRERFHLDWLHGHLDGSEPPQDVQSTLSELTARGIADAIDRWAPHTREVALCGGGARNADLRGRIARLLAGREVRLTDELGVSTGDVEAVAFAWLAMKFVRGEPIDLRAVTGSRHPVRLGALYPA